MDSDKKNIIEKGLLNESSFDPFIDLSDMKKRELLKYTNRDLYLSNLKVDILPGKTLFFPFCGLDNLDCLKSLDYQNIILVDSQFRDYSCEYLNNGRKVIKIDMDGICAVLLLLDLNIKISTFIGIKGDIHSDFPFLMNLSIPLLQEKLIFVGPQKKVGPFRVSDDNIKQLPYRSRINIESDYFKFFTDYELKDIHQIFGTYYDVVLLEKLSTRSKVVLINNKRIYLLQQSIWSYIDMLDIAFMTFSNQFQQSIVNQDYDKIFDVQGKYISDDGLELNMFQEFSLQVICNMKGANSVGISNNWRILEQVKMLLQPKNKITDIYLFCPDQEDFNQLYFQRFDEIDDDDF